MSVVVPSAGSGVRAGLGLGSRGAQRAALLAAALTVVGVFSVFSTDLSLWALWTTDPLKSIGGFIPVLSLYFILRVWRSMGWEMKGTWWGLVILAATVVLVHVRDHAILEFILGPSWSIFLPPHSLVAFGYAAGAVLLFGGVTLFRRSLFPVVLMWFVNPVPNFFTLHVDLPLQHASSLIARAFAHALGQKLSPDQLRLMFTPEFGMFIAPGCNGIRGAITMGFIALIAGYLYQFKAKVWAAVVVGAVALGYVFNLVRLCTLVLYYIVALRIPWLQSRAEMGDYIIGACLFFFATAVLFTLIQRLNPGGNMTPPRLVRGMKVGRGVVAPVGYANGMTESMGMMESVHPGHEGRTPGFVAGAGAKAQGEVAWDRGLKAPSNPGEAAAVSGEERGRSAMGSFWLRWGAFAALVVVGSVSYARGLVRDHDAVGDPKLAASAAQIAASFPKRVGAYTLRRQWSETLVTGQVIFLWADYVPDAAVGAKDDVGAATDDGSGPVSVGISPVLGAHDTLLCHSARGEDWLWHGDLLLPTVAAATNFSGSFFNDGATQYLEATTVCTGETCGQFTSARRHFGFVYSRPDTKTLLSQSPTRPIPVLLRTETLNASMAPDQARAMLTANLAKFLAGADLSVFTKPYR